MIEGLRPPLSTSLCSQLVCENKNTGTIFWDYFLRRNDTPVWLCDWMIFFILASPQKYQIC